MSKKRKTKKEKIIAQLRRQQALLKSTERPASSTEAKPATPKTSYELPLSAPLIKEIASDDTQKSKSYTYVLKDASRTIIITTLIIGLQLALLIAIENKLISLSMLGL